MGNARAARQSGVKGFGEIAEKGNAVISRDTQSLEYPVRSCQHILKWTGCAKLLVMHQRRARIRKNCVID